MYVSWWCEYNRYILPNSNQIDNNFTGRSNRKPFRRKPQSIRTDSKQSLLPRCLLRTIAQQVRPVPGENPLLKSTPQIIFFGLQRSVRTSIHFHSHITGKFTGPDRDVDRGALFIQHKFVLRNSDSRKVLYPHFTTATDTANVRVVFQAIMEMVISENLGRVTLLWVFFFCR